MGRFDIFKEISKVQSAIYGLPLSTVAIGLELPLARKAASMGIIEQPTGMHAKFKRSLNADGVRQWRCIGVFAGRVTHTEYSEQAASDEVEGILVCNIKRAPKVGAYCRRPSFYM